MGTILGLDAVVLIAKDLQAQGRFYREVLGLPLTGDYGDALFFDCGSQKLALFAQSHHPEGTKRLEGASKGISHLEFRIASDDEPSLRRRLTEAGFHAYRDNFHDADGNLFHFNLAQ
jgi:catechol 2,3-dioxygenase-like lactoylglutathione lyase family enzyme